MKIVEFIVFEKKSMSVNSYLLIIYHITYRLAQYINAHCTMSALLEKLFQCLKEYLFTAK